MADLIATDRLLANEAAFMDWLAAPREGPELVWYLNPFTLAHYRAGRLKVPGHARVVADGGLMAGAVAQALGAPHASLHFDFSGLAEPVFQTMAAQGLRLAVIGGKPGEAATFADIVNRRYQGPRVVMTRDGYFSRARQGDVIAEVDRAEPDVVLLSMGSPRQEAFGGELMAAAKRPMVIITCGAFVSQTVTQAATGRAAYYPPFFVKFNVRYLYRLWREPKMALRVARFYLPYLARLKLMGPDVPFDGA